MITLRFSIPFEVLEYLMDLIDEGVVDSNIGPNNPTYSFYNPEDEVAFILKYRCFII